MNSTLSLYDEPGPRTRRRILIWSVVSAVVILGLITLALVQFASKGQLDSDRWLPFLDIGIWEYLGVGLLGTLQAAALTAVFGFVLGLLLALGRLSRVRWISWLCTAYIEIARTVPVLLLIYLMLFGLPQLGLNFPVLWKLVIPLTIANAAAFAEIIRAGVLALPRGQAEAGLSLGMTRWQVDRKVVLPQALRFVAPSLVVQLVSLLKDTSLGYIVAFTELLYRGQVLSSFNGLLIQTFVVVTVIFLALNGGLSGLAARLQKRPGRRSLATPAKVAPAGLTTPNAPVDR